MVRTDVGLMLRMAMKEKGIKNQDLAEAAGMSKTFLSGYVNGLNDPHYVSKTLITVADAMGCDVEVRLIEKKEIFIMTREFIDSARNIYGNVRKLSNNDGDKCVDVLKVMQDIEVEALLGMEGITDAETKYIRERCEASAKARGEEAPKDAYGYIGKTNLEPPKPYVDGYGPIYEGEGIPEDVIIDIEEENKKGDHKKRK